MVVKVETDRVLLYQHSHQYNLKTLMLPRWVVHPVLVELAVVQMLERVELAEEEEMVVVVETMDKAV